MALTTTQVSQLYVAIFNRASEGEGNTFWQAQDDAASAATAMLATDAAVAYFGTSLDSNSAFIQHIYLNTFSKTIFNDAAGIQFWVDALDGGASRGSVVADIVAAATDAANAGDAQDQFNNRVAVSDHASATLSTPPADFETSLVFGTGGLVVTEDAATVTTASTAVTALGSTGGGSGGSTGNTVLLTTGQDNLTGTDGEDQFKGYIFDNQNTAQSGDVIDGGAGDDSLYVDVGDSQSFAVTLHTTNVETFSARAQAIGGDSNENNLISVEFDAERMNGVTRYESDNSRADVIVEDVRIEASEITKDITIAMVQTDPGNVDFGVYFDQHSLRAAPETTAGAVLNLQIMDTRATDNGDDPLKDNPYRGFAFTLDSTLYQVQSDAIDDAQTYAAFLTAVQDAVAATAGLENFTAAISGTFVAVDTLSSNSLTGQVITLTNSGTGTIAEQGWLVSGTVPSSSGLHLLQDTAAPTVTGNLITSAIVLDDVGRGSMGGDLVIGGLSTGSTSDSKGVERFEIVVERSSELQEIHSTNNTLQEVSIVNGATNGNLVVAGNQNGDDNLPGADADAWGLTDVRLVDASAMVGSVNLNAVLSENIVGKFMDRVDFGLPGADNIDFMYTLGTSSDTLDLTISNANLEAAGTTSREDFTLVVNGGAGNDSITTIIGDGAGNDGTAWYENSKINANLSIDGGSGNDTITTTGTGDFVINAGSGDDTVYTDNSGDKGSWIVNATAASSGAEAAAIASDVVTNGLIVAEDATPTVINAATTALAVTAAKVITAASTQTAAEIAAIDLALDIAVLQAGATQADIYAALLTGFASVAATGAELVTDGDTITGTANSLISGTTLTVTYAGAAANSVIGAVATANTAGYESTVDVLTSDGMGNEMSMVQAIKDAINNDAVLSKLLVATDSTGGTLEINSLIDGLSAATDLQFTVTAPTALANSLTAAELTEVKAAWNDILNTSAAVITDAAMYVQIGVAAAATLGAIPGVANAAIAQSFGNESTATSDNVVTVGAGDDVVVLGTNDALFESNDTVVFSGTSFGDVTVVNYADATLAATAGVDLLDFTAYLGNQTSVSGSADSAVTIATTLAATAGVAAGTVMTENQVHLVTGFTDTATETWAALTAANVKTAINGGALYANLGNAVDSAADVATLLADTQNYVIMIENGLNAGEYKVFSLTATDDTTTTAFDVVTLVGTVDFGDDLATIATADFV